MLVLQVVSLRNQPTTHRLHQAVMLGTCRQQHTVTIMFALQSRRFHNPMNPRLEHLIGENLHGVPQIHDGVTRFRAHPPPILTFHIQPLDLGGRIRDLQPPKPGEQNRYTHGILVWWETVLHAGLVCGDGGSARVPKDPEEVPGIVVQAVQFAEGAAGQMELLFEDGEHRAGDFVTGREDGVEGGGVGVLT